MRIKAAVLGVMMIIVSAVFAACGKADDGKITTENAGTSSTAISSTTIGMMDEMSSIAGDVSEGLSEAGSELRKGITRMYD